VSIRKKKNGSHPNLYLHTGRQTHLRVNTHMQKFALYEQRHTVINCVTANSH